MYRARLRRLLHRLKLTLRIEQRLTLEECYQLLQLSEAIVEYGRMVQAYYGYSVPNVMVELPELASRFRETPQTIKDALLLLGEKGRAEPTDLPGCWQLRLADTRRSEGDDKDKEDAGAA